ncbi:MAG: hypothetical protein ACRDKT_09710 [Actinomycetota bacterium]
MAERRKLTKRDLERIVKRAEAGMTQREIQEETGLGQSVVGPVLVWAGFRKSRPDIRKYEKARVERWLAAGRGRK